MRSSAPNGAALPLAFPCFGVGTLLLGGVALEWIHRADVSTAGIFLAAFVFPLEFLTCAVLPTGRRGAAARVFESDLDDQTTRLQREAGVRTQL